MTFVRFLLNFDFLYFFRWLLVIIISKNTEDLVILQKRLVIAIQEGHQESIYNIFRQAGNSCQYGNFKNFLATPDNLLLAIKYNKPNSVLALLNLGISPNNAPYYIQPLCEAVKPPCNTNIVQYLINKNAFLDRPDLTNRTALEIALNLKMLK